MIGFLTRLSVLMVVQDVPVYVPPPAPPIKGGAFTCDIFDRSGEKLSIAGEIGNWRTERGDQVIDLKIDAPKSSDLSITDTVLVKPLKVDFHAYDNATKIVVSGTLDVGYGREGRIMLERQRIDGTGLRTFYVGFCDTQFSTYPRKVSK
jgi:hypothetical protein